MVVAAQKPTGAVKGPLTEIVVHNGDGVDRQLRTVPKVVSLTLVFVGRRILLQKTLRADIATDIATNIITSITKNPIMRTNIHVLTEDLI
jgi:hypothetical protein